MKIAAIQMVSGPQVAANLMRARTLLESAAAQGAELAVLPEYFCLLGMRDTDKRDAREPFGDGVIQRFLAQAACELNLWIAGGTLPLATQATAPTGHDEGRVRNSLLVFSNTGECVARYDKIHLFRFDNGSERYDESRVLEAGSEPRHFDMPSRDGHTWRVALSVCYDLRFPELYRAASRDGAHVLLVPSAFTYTTGQAHWDILLRARAVENLSWVVAAAQGGTHENGRRTWGHTLVADPWGLVVAQQDEGEGVVMAELSRARLLECRAQLPALDHRVM